MLGQFNEQFELNEEEKEILERLIKQAQFDDDENEAFCLMIDMEYAKKKVTEYIEMEDDYANYANEYFEGLNAEFEEKSSKRAKNIIDNLTWSIVEPFYYNDNYDCNFVEHSCTNVYKIDEYLKAAFVDFVNHKNEEAKRIYPNLSECEEDFCCYTYEVNSVVYKINENDNYIFISKEEHYAAFESDIDEDF